LTKVKLSNVYDKMFQARARRSCYLNSRLF